jgi:ABC-type Na+ transport system ATPase subunit NatA
VRTLRRENGEIVGAFGRNGRNAGEFHWVHNLAVDSKGNIYTTEVDTGKRAQKFRYTGPAVR